MPSLHILKGANQGATVPLAKDRFVIGRNPECDVVIPITSVSREHAQILRVQGRFHIEDMQSRIGDFLAVFLDADPDAHEDDGGQENSSTVEATLSHSSSLVLLETQPAEKLRGLLEIS